MKVGRLQQQGGCDNRGTRFVEYDSGRKVFDEYDDADFQEYIFFTKKKYFKIQKKKTNLIPKVWFLKPTSPPSH